ncbi:DUF5984 family protein [Paenibacillus anseongense]|uniref:DUF5984 family protein n=2 Tax=Paenibacillus TaxID=44249 RepID=UPI002DB7143A|nr:DUF5984 family protein [Paenibacillus anseongense]MEC0264808.1 DUF5984 family protein [Paenibacillus anseongense]
MLKFVLKNPFEIPPWGEENNLMLHWFGLTDSYYWFDFGDVKLLRYSDGFVNQYKLNKNLPYNDYQFARVFWDLTDIILNVLNPIPDSVFDNIRTFGDFESYFRSLSDWVENQWNESDEDFENIYLQARKWIDDRRLDFGYLIGAPNLYFFKNKDKIYIRWIADYKDENGIYIWETMKGEYVIEFDKFISELQLSIKNFAINMETQIKFVLENSIKNVFIDKKRLQENNNEFLEEVKKYEKILSSVPEQTDWDDVLSKVKIIKEPLS